MMMRTLARRQAYAERLLTMETVAKAVSADERFRPAVPKAWPRPIVDLLHSCWAQEPEGRPSFQTLCVELDGLVEEARASLDKGTPNEVLNGLTPRGARVAASSREGGAHCTSPRAWGGIGGVSSLGLSLFLFFVRS